MADLTPVTARRDMAAFLGQKERMDHFAALLQGKGIEPAAFVAAVQADAIRTPKLAEAIASAPDTLMDALSVCAASGLLPGSAHGQFYLIPRWSAKRGRTECTFITGYKGLCDIAYRHPRVFSVRAAIAFQGEEFEYDPGASTIRHKWNGDVPRDKLEHIHAAYAMVELSTPSGQHAGGRPLIRVMTQREILDAMARSETGRKGYGPWKDDPIPMALKTPLRRLLSGGSVPRLYDLIHLLAKESQQEEIADPAPTSRVTGVAGLKASIADSPIETAAYTMPADPDARRALLAQLRPDEDPGMLSDEDVESQLRDAIRLRNQPTAATTGRIPRRAAAGLTSRVPALSDASTLRGPSCLTVARPSFRTDACSATLGWLTLAETCAAWRLLPPAPRDPRWQTELLRRGRFFVLLARMPTRTSGQRDPFLPFFGDDFYGSQHVMLMSPVAEFAYHRLLWLAWRDGSIPADPAQIARLVPKITRDEFMAVWPEIAPCWKPRGDRLVQPYQEELREERAAYRERRSAAGKAGNQARWSPAIANGSDCDADAIAKGSPPLPLPLPLPSPLPSPVPEGTSPSVQEGTVQATHKSPEGWFPYVEGRGALRDDQLPESVDGMLLAIGYRSNSQTQLVDVFRATERFKREHGTLADMRRLCERARKRGKDPAAMLAAWLDKGTWGKELSKRG